MRLFVPSCRNCEQKVHLNVVRETRSELRAEIGNPFELECNHCGEVHQYQISEVQAEKGAPSSAAGTIIGGAIGIAGGPIGIVLGALGGAILGANAEEEEGEKVEKFNNSGYNGWS